MKAYYEYNLKEMNINHSFIVDLKNVLAYMKFMETRPLTGLEELELRECLQYLKEGGFENVVKALGF